MLSTVVARLASGAEIPVVVPGAPLFPRNNVVHQVSDLLAGFVSDLAAVVIPGEYAGAYYLPPVSGVVGTFGHAGSALGETTGHGSSPRLARSSGTRPMDATNAWSGSVRCPARRGGFY